MLKELVTKNRSYRRFYETEKISRETLLFLVDNARLSASGANKQALRYFISCDGKTNEKIFSTLAWAGYLSDWKGPEPGERPAGYIILLQDENFKCGTPADSGIAVQSILLGAVEAGFGGCIVASVQRKRLQEALDIPPKYEILLVVALGKPRESVVIEEIEANGDIKYWRDEQRVHHVPKRKLEDIVINYK
ncbi:MAG: nitroreductase family protein [Smithella sp.]